MFRSWLLVTHSHYVILESVCKVQVLVISDTQSLCHIGECM